MMEVLFMNPYVHKCMTNEELYYKIYEHGIVLGLNLYSNRRGDG